MYYYKEDEDTYYKYEVSFDRDKVLNLLDEVKKRCSIISLEAFRGSEKFNPYYRHNYEKAKERGIKNFDEVTFKDLIDYGDQIHELTIYKYEYTRLVYLINELLNGNSYVINEIFNPKRINKFNFDKKIESLKRRLDSGKKINYKFESLMKKELSKLTILKEINENQISDEIYYLKLQKLIKFNLVDTLDKDIKKRTDNFFERKLKK